MMYRILFDDQWFRTVPSCMIDARVGTLMANAIGTVMESIIQQKLALVVPGVLTYKIETSNGNLVGVFALKPASGVVSVIFLVIRPAFQQFASEINLEISTFITESDWFYDT